MVTEKRKSLFANHLQGKHPCGQQPDFPKRQARDRQARDDYQKEKTAASPVDAIYMIDILRQKWTNDDSRL
jgi:hypothetical protein